MESDTPRLALDLARVSQHHFAKHRISPGPKARSVVEAAGTAVGLHAARLQSPYAALHARCDTFENADLHRELFVERSVVKLRCMRRTLHIVPLSLAPVVHQASLQQRMSPCVAACRMLGVGRKKLDFYRSVILERALTQGIRATDFAPLGVVLFKTRFDEARRVEATRWIIKTLWEEGSLCYVNRAGEWGKEEREYRATSEFYPSLHLTQLSNEEAEARLVLHHVEQYGPVALGDIVWWSGLSQGRISRALHALRPKVERIDVNGLGRDLYISCNDIETLESTTGAQDSWVALLAYEDPALKGYFSTRNRYVASLHYGMLFNAIGEVRASVILNGVVIGIWTYNRGAHTIEISFFQPVDRAVERMVYQKSEELLTKFTDQHCSREIKLAS